jgi:hypothetical protein
MPKAVKRAVFSGGRSEKNAVSVGFAPGQVDALRLRAVAQRCIEDEEALAGHAREL